MSTCSALPLVAAGLVLAGNVVACGRFRYEHLRPGSAGGMAGAAAGGGPQLGGAPGISGTGPGGSSATGGSANGAAGAGTTGGLPVAGGAASGGSTAGGTTTGGATGAAGAIAMGGASAGSPPVGGASPGGAAAGGAPAGGAPAGGVVNGGGAAVAAQGGTAEGGTAPAGGAAPGGSVNGGADTGGASAVCVPDAICSCSSYEGRDYRFCNAVLFYADALVDCQAQGMTLVKVDDEVENAWVTAEAIAAGMLVPGGSTVVFLGGDQIEVSGEWRWLDGTLFWLDGAVAGVYANWETPPKGGVKDCVALRADGLWLDRACNSGDARYICEAP